MATHGLEKQQELGLTDVETAYALSAPWAAGTGTVRSLYLNSFDILMIHLQTIVTIEIFLRA